MATAEMLPDATRNPGLHPWFALRVRSNFERMAYQGLRGRGFDPYLPMYRQRRQLSDRIKEGEYPLFPGYVFCRMDPQNRLPVLMTPGVVHVVGLGKIPTPIPEAEIGAVQALLQSGLPANPWPYLHAGQPILIASGPLAGTEGILVECKNTYRLVVSVHLLQRSVSAEVDAAWVRPLTPTRQWRASQAVA